MKRLVFLMFVFTTLLSCTTFNPSGFTGGYKDAVGDYELYLRTTRDNILETYGHDILYEVSASGNAFASEEKVLNILLGRCGMIAIENGCKYFYIIDSDSDVSTQTSVNSNYQTYNNYGYSNTYVNNYTKHSKSAIIIIAKEMIDGWERPYNAERYYNIAKGN